MNFKNCSRCLMDESADSITFDENGYCNYCNEFITKSSPIKNLNKDRFIKDFINLIKKRNGKYDCIVGVSGGIDSSYVLVKCVEMGLKPLAVHMDNGWNSHIAQNNISNLVRDLDVDLITHVINWKEYRSLMNSFFKSHVIDIELLYDHAMLAINYKIANKFRIKYIISGSNRSTEGFEMPKNWNWFKYDKKNIKSINQHFENIQIKTFPFIGIYKFIYYRMIKKIEWIAFLDYLDYKKEEAQAYLIKKFNFIPYPYKHYESVFTRFYQGYILPKKFGIDKRKIHLSNLIMTNQLSRDEGLKILSQSPYSSELEIRNDINFFLKKMNWTLKNLNDYINSKEIKHSFYKNDYKTWKKLVYFKKLLK